MNELTINKLSKTYENSLKALDDLCLSIGTGMFGLLGPNGAGKSSLMRTIATLQEPDSGTIAFNDIDVINDKMALRKVLGYLPQSFGVYPKINAEKLLEYFAKLKGISSKAERDRVIQNVLELTNLYDVRKSYVANYSGGMKQRFGIAQLLLNKPKLIIVDEPTAGLDPEERHRFLNVLREISTNNTIIFSTHIVDDVKDLCHDMAILNHGKIQLQAKPDEACKKFRGKIWTKTIQHEVLESIENSFNLISTNFNHDNTINVRIYSEEKPKLDFKNAEPVLEDVYFLSLNTIDSKKQERE